MHDVAPATWQRCKKLLDALREVASFPATLLLVPRYHHSAPAALDKNFCSIMSQCQSNGDELVLHGLYHQDDVATTGTMDLLKRQIYTAGEGEFATLSKEEAARRIDEGLQWFASEGFKASGFVAPAWLASPGTWQALEATSLRYSTTLSGLHVLKHGQKPLAPCRLSRRRRSRRLSPAARALGAFRPAPDRCRLPAGREALAAPFAKV
jgi:predicted deacetylase